MLGLTDVSTLIEVSQDSNHWLGTYGPLQVVFWVTGEMSPEVCGRMLELAKEVNRRNRVSRPAVLSIPCQTVRRPPSLRSRQALADLITAGGDQVSRVAVAYEGRGVIATSVLKVMSGLQILVSPRHGHRFFSSIGDALRWVTEDLDEFRSGAIRYEAARMAIEGQNKRLRSQWLANSKPTAVATTRPF